VRRWPDELAAELSQEWQAELAALRADRTLPWARRALRAVGFAASLAVWPAVEPAGAAPRTRRDRTAAVGETLLVPAVVTLSGAALFNAVHLLSRPVGPLAARAAAGLVLLAVAVGAMVAAGVLAATRRSYRPVIGVVLPVGLALYAFLLAGNRVAVMPFMGWRDIGPGVVAWTALTAVAAGAAARLTASGRRRLGLFTGVAGVVVALDAATACGSAHAAAALGAGARWAAAWFPLTLLPGGAVSFGPSTGTWPGRHASAILLGNAAAMAGPMLLCSAFVLAYAIRRARPDALPARVPAPARWLPLGLGAAVLATAGYQADGALGRLADNTQTFGFGFAGTVGGHTLLAVAVGLPAIWYAAGKRGRATPM
jgi:hypothetical protein